MTRRQLATAALAAPFVTSSRARADNGQLLTNDLTRDQLFQKFLVNPWERNNPTVDRTLALPSQFTFPVDVLYDCTVTPSGKCVTDTSKPRQSNVMFGIDINHYTKDTFSFNQLRGQQIRFIQMKATQGRAYKDGKFAGFWARAGNLPSSAKIYRGAYHFLTADAPGKVQADWFLANLGTLQSGDMAPGVDLEWDVYTNTGDLDHWAGKGAQYIIDNALSCLERIKDRTGRTPVLYTGRSWFGPATIPLARFSEFAAYPLWVFDYNPQRKITEKPVLPGTTQAALWQYTSSAAVPLCYDSGLDASIFYGDEPAFKTMFGIA